MKYEPLKDKKIEIIEGVIDPWMIFDYSSIFDFKNVKSAVEGLKQETNNAYAVQPSERKIFLNLIDKWFPDLIKGR